MENISTYFTLIGVEDEQQAFELVKKYCFLQNETPLNDQVKSVLAVCVANGLDPRMGEIYDEYLDGDYQMTGIVIPTLRIRGWYRLADNSGRVKGVEFVYSDDQVSTTGGTEIFKWIECQVWVDDNERPITARVFGTERVQFGGAWLTMPNQRLEQSAYTAAISRALGVRGLNDADTVAMLKVESLGREQPVQVAPGSASEAVPHTEGEQQEPVQVDVVDEAETMQSVDPQQTKTSQEDSGYFEEPEFEEVMFEGEGDLFSAANATLEHAPEEEQYLEQGDFHDDQLPDAAASETVQHSAPEQSAPPAAPEYRPTLKDQRLLKNLITTARTSNTWAASMDYVDSQPYDDGLKAWLLVGLKEASPKAA